MDLNICGVREYETKALNTDYSLALINCSDENKVNNKPKDKDTIHKFNFALHKELEYQNTLPPIPDLDSRIPLQHKP